MKRKIVVFGPGPRFKGGIANFTAALCNALIENLDTEIHLVSWTQQYPAIIPRDFVDPKSNDRILNNKVHLHYITNYNNPISWKKTADLIIKLNPEKVIVQWAIAIQGLPLGYIFKRVRQNCKAEIIFDVHNVIQKENSLFDRSFTRSALGQAHHYIMHGPSTISEFQTFYPEKTFQISTDGNRNWTEQSILKLYHPIYDIFKVDSNFDVASEKQKRGLKKHVFLFFGFIRKYKGLHYAIDAFAALAKERDDVSLLIVGESFWKTDEKTSLSKSLKKSVFKLLKKLFIKSRDQETDYNPLEKIKALNLEQSVVLVNEFVPNEDVHLYFQMCDSVVNFYEYATPSGVESIAYQFLKPVLATPVGHFKETIIDGENGYLSPSFDVDDMKNTLTMSIEKPISIAHIQLFKNKLSWKNYADCILKNPTGNNA